MPRSKQIAPHIGRYSRSQLAAKRGLYKGAKKSEPKPKPVPKDHKEVTVGGEKNGQTRIVPVHKAPRYYPAEDVRKPKDSRKHLKPVTKLRGSITPGTVLILLAGRFRGKRVVFLKQLASGLLLVTGPFKVNGVPLRRVNQAYTIATSTKVDITTCGLPEELNDSYFAKSKAGKSVSAEEEYFSNGKPKEKEALSAEKLKLQKDVDAAIIAEVKKVDSLSKYLGATWGLSKGQYPHSLVF